MWTGCCYSLLYLTLALQKRSRDKRVQTFFKQKDRQMFLSGVCCQVIQKKVLVTTFTSTIETVGFIRLQYLIHSKNNFF